jgi:4-diphosphocytidyl-2-C-methyl-D-erythritol kinase
MSGSAHGWDRATGTACRASCRATAAGRDGVVGWTPAKVNLFLEVGGHRPDGYHAVETLIVAVNLFDTLEARTRGDGQLSLACDAPGVPVDATNLVVRAANALRGDRPLGAALRLTKRIPHAAGLGGGSSDAALALFVLNRLWRLNFSTAELLEVAATVGSDVGVFLGGAAGWCTGRGEVIEPTELGGPLDFAIVKPDTGLSTAAVYRGHTPPPEPAASAPMRIAAKSGKPELVAAELHNRLEAPAFAAEPRLSEVRDRLRALNPLGVLLCGSGSSVFALARNPADAARIAREYRPAASSGERVFAVRSLSGSPTSAVRPAARSAQ